MQCHPKVGAMAVETAMRMLNPDAGGIYAEYIVVGPCIR